MEQALSIFAGLGGVSGLITLLVAIFRLGRVYQRMEAVESRIELLVREGSRGAETSAGQVSVLHNEMHKSTEQLHGRISGQVSDLRTAIDALRQRLGELAGAHALTEKDVSFVKQQYNDIVHKLSAVSDSLADASRRHASLASQISELNRRIGELTPQVSQHDRDIAAIQARAQ